MGIAALRKWAWGSVKRFKRKPALTDPEVLSRLFAPIGNDFVAHLGTLIEVAQARFLNGGEMCTKTMPRPHSLSCVLAAGIWLDKAIALGWVRKIAQRPPACSTSRADNPCRSG
jgi:hypothetical protein